jgi:hypothetical protein
MRIGLGPLSVEGIPRGRYRVLEQRDVDALTKPAKKHTKHTKN